MVVMRNPCQARGKDSNHAGFLSSRPALPPHGCRTHSEHITPASLELSKHGQARFHLQEGLEHLGDHRNSAGLEDAFNICCIRK